MTQSHNDHTHHAMYRDLIVTRRYERAPDTNTMSERKRGVLAHGILHNITVQTEVS
jgi:hypothetical protein